MRSPSMRSSTSAAPRNHLEVEPLCGDLGKEVAVGVAVEDRAEPSNGNSDCRLDFGGPLGIALRCLLEFAKGIWYRLERDQLAPEAVPAQLQTRLSMMSSDVQDRVKLELREWGGHQTPVQTDGRRVASYGDPASVVEESPHLRP